MVYQGIWYAIYYLQQCTNWKSPSDSHCSVKLDRDLSLNTWPIELLQPTDPNHILYFLIRPDTSFEPLSLYLMALNVVFSSLLPFSPSSLWKKQAITLETVSSCVFWWNLDFVNFFILYFKSYIFLNSQNLTEVVKLYFAPLAGALNI